MTLAVLVAILLGMHSNSHSLNTIEYIIPNDIRCGPCNMGLPIMNDLNNEIRRSETLYFLGTHSDSEYVDFGRFNVKVVEVNHAQATKMGLEGYPTIRYKSKNGNILKERLGVVGFKDLKQDLYEVTGEEGFVE